MATLRKWVKKGGKGKGPRKNKLETLEEGDENLEGDELGNGEGGSDGEVINENDEDNKDNS